MFYQFLRLVVFIASKLYFKSSHIRNIEQVPRKGAMILAANHPSTFLDPLMVAVWLRRPLYFLANGGIFTNNFLKWLLRQFFMVPIYRKQDSSNLHEQALQNEKSFAACYEMLGSGGALGIFPEGISENERKLRKIKTGLARIALGAAEKYEWTMEVQIVCVGINYTQSQQFQSEVFVQYDTPILVTKYKEAYRKNPTETIHQLTKEIEDRLAALIVVTADKETDELTHQLEVLYSNDLKNYLELPEDDTEQIFTVAQYFADAISYFKQKYPQEALVFTKKVQNYFLLLQRQGLKDHIVANYYPEKLSQKLFLHCLFFFWGFPFFLLGILHNYLPYKLPSWLARGITKDKGYYPAMHFGIGTVTFSLFYFIYTKIYIYILQLFFNPINWYFYIIVLSILLVMGVLGFFAYSYANTWKDWRALHRLHQWQDKENVMRLRQQLLLELEQWRDEYISQAVKKTT